MEKSVLDGKWYKVLGPKGESISGGKYKWNLPTGNKPGRWTKAETRPVICKRGYHLTRVDHLPEWLNSNGDSVIYLAQPTGVFAEDETKTAFEQVRLLKKIAVVPHPVGGWIQDQHLDDLLQEDLTDRNLVSQLNKLKKEYNARFDHPNKLIDNILSAVKKIIKSKNFKSVRDIGEFSKYYDSFTDLDQSFAWGYILGANPKIVKMYTELVGIANQSAYYDDDSEHGYQLACQVGELLRKK